MATELVAPSPKQMFSRLVQVGVVVRDLDRVLKALEEIFGIGPFRTIDYPPQDWGRDDWHRHYYGEPGDFTARLAVVDLGVVELELIQPTSGRSIWFDFLEKHGEGLHHLRFNVDDVDQVVGYLGRKGIRPSQGGDGLWPSARYVYFDTEEVIGFCLEIRNQIPGTDGKSPAEFQTPPLSASEKPS